MPPKTVKSALHSFMPSSSPRRSTRPPRRGGGPTTDTTKMSDRDVHALRHMVHTMTMQRTTCLQQMNCRAMTRAQTQATFTALMQQIDDMRAQLSGRGNAVVVATSAPTGGDMNNDNQSPASKKAKHSHDGQLQLPPTTMRWMKALKKAQLQRELRQRGWPVSGKKDELQVRLRAALEQEHHRTAAAAAAAAADDVDMVVVMHANKTTHGGGCTQNNEISGSADSAEKADNNNHHAMDVVEEDAATANHDAINALPPPADAAPHPSSRSSSSAAVNTTKAAAVTAAAAAAATGKTSMESDMAVAMMDDATDMEVDVPPLQATAPSPPPANKSPMKAAKSPLSSPQRSPLQILSAVQSGIKKFSSAQKTTKSPPPPQSLSPPPPPPSSSAAKKPWRLNNAAAPTVLSSKKEERSRSPPPGSVEEAENMTNAQTVGHNATVLPPPPPLAHKPATAIAQVLDEADASKMAAAVVVPLPPPPHDPMDEDTDEFEFKGHNERDVTAFATVTKQRLQAKVAERKAAMAEQMRAKSKLVRDKIGGTVPAPAPTAASSTRGVGFSKFSLSYSASSSKSGKPTNLFASSSKSARHHQKLTAPAQIPERAPTSPLDTYDISDDEGSSHVSDKTKYIPPWAHSEALAEAVKKQNAPDYPYYADEIFGQAQTCDLQAIFGKPSSSRSRMTNRSSSANWQHDQLTPNQQLVYKRTVLEHKQLAAAAREHKEQQRTQQPSRSAPTPAAMR